MITPDSPPPEAYRQKYPFAGCAIQAKGNADAFLSLMVAGDASHLAEIDERRRIESRKGITMHSVILFLKAAGIGLAVATPIRPMALLCMRRGLSLGWKDGLATGLGIATGDGIYALVAVAGLTDLSHFLLVHVRSIHYAAAFALLYLGIVTMRKGSTAEPPAPTRGTYLGSVLLTLTNPPTIIAFAAFFSALAPSRGFDFNMAVLTVSGVFSGSLLWWCGLISMISSFRSTVGERTRHTIDKVARAFFLAFGLIELRRAGGQ